MKHSYSAGGVVIGPNKKILVVSQNGNSWSLPKGTLEKNENEKSAAAREIKEESGITKLVFLKSLGTYERYRISLNGGDDKELLKTITVFLYSTPEIDLNPLDPNNPEARWVDIERAGELLTHPMDKQFFNKQINIIKKYLS